jgi:hypothetical protein
MAGLSSFIYPYLFAFSESAGLDYFSLFLNFCFLCDIVISFRTSYINKITGDEIYSPAKIAKRYGLSLRVIFDLVSIIPFNYFKVGLSSNSGISRLFIVVKIFKIMRIN